MGKMKEINSSKGVLFGLCSTSYCTDAKKEMGINTVATKCIEVQQSKCCQLGLARVSRVSSCLSLL